MKQWLSAHHCSKKLQSDPELHPPLIGTCRASSMLMGLSLYLPFLLSMFNNWLCSVPTNRVLVGSELWPTLLQYESCIVEDIGTLTVREMHEFISVACKNKCKAQFYTKFAWRIVKASVRFFCWALWRFFPNLLKLYFAFPKPHVITFVNTCCIIIGMCSLTALFYSWFFYFSKPPAEYRA